MQSFDIRSRPEHQEIRERLKRVSVEPSWQSDIYSVGCYYYLDRFFGERQYRDEEMPENSAAFFGIARYAWLLEKGYRELEGKFDLDEFMALADTYPGNFFSPSDAESMATVVGGHFGWEKMQDVPDEMKGMMRQLVTLSPLARCALADALERIWHFPETPNEQVNFDERRERVGFKLRE